MVHISLNLVKPSVDGQSIMDSSERLGLLDVIGAMSVVYS